MSRIGTVAVAGLGLIGGSAARDLARAGVRVLGWDADERAVEAALAAGVLAEALGEGLPGVEDADVLLVAVPVLAAPALLESALPRLRHVRLITDAGSTKASLAAAAERLGLGARFVGAHPLAGSHESGWAAAREGLFRGARVYLCPTAETSADALGLARELWGMLGGEAMEIDAREHDERLAWTSHLPQLIATALANVLAGQGIARAELGPGGRDMTRLAASSPAMWADILRDNRGHVAAALAALEAELHALRLSLGDDDRPTLLDAFSLGNHWSR